jgi:HPt (histidine-containing phosphotransfer) domain-containing protein
MAGVELTGRSGILNLAAALDHIGGDRELLVEVAGLFLENSPRLMVQIKEAVEAGNSYKLEQAAHALKGSASNFAAESTVEAALRLETMGRSLELAGVREAYRVLESEMGRLCPVLAEIAGSGTVR